MKLSKMVATSTLSASKILTTAALHLVLAAGVMLTLSCAKDQNLEDYKNQEFQEGLAKDSVANGRYTGFAVSESDGKTKVGALQLTLQASAQQVQSNDETQAQLQPVINVNLDFQGQTLSTIHAPSGSFDPDTGIFQAQIMVTGTAASGSSGTASNNSGSSSSGSSGSSSSSGSGTASYTININGKLDSSGVLSGTIEAQGFPGFGFNFSVQRDGPSLTDLASQATPTALLQHLNYQGQTQFTGNGGTNGVTKNLNLTILNPTTSSEQDFINVVVPTKTLIVNLNYGADAQIAFNNATYDERTGRLEGQTTLTSTIPGSTTSSSGSSSAGSGQTASGNGISVIIYLQCQLQKGTNGFDCSHTTNASSSTVAITRVTPASDTAPPPTDDSSERQQIQYKYKGTADLPIVTLPGMPSPKPGSANKHNFLMSVVYQTRTRLQEITLLFAPATEEEYVQVGLFVTDPNTYFGDNFANAIFDHVAQTIVGNEQFNTPNNTPATTQLSCQSFDFNDPAKSKYNFTCVYTGSIGTSGTTITFRN